MGKRTFKADETLLNDVTDYVEEEPDYITRVSI